MLDITHGKAGVGADRRELQHPEGLWLVLDLLKLPGCHADTRAQVVSMLATAATSKHVPANIEVWRTHAGMDEVLELLLLSCGAPVSAGRRGSAAAATSPTSPTSGPAAASTTSGGARGGMLPHVLLV